MPTFGLREHYLQYIDALNQRRFDDLPEFVSEELIYNDASITGAQYRQMLENDVRTIPDLVFEVDLLVVGDEHVACRIRFDCTPQERFKGLEPTGSRVAFAEHVFYRFDGPHIIQVWSLLDVEALQRQLPGH